MARRSRFAAWEIFVERLGPDECWPWRGRTDAHGYGRFKAEGNPDPFLAHRVAFEIGTGREPVGVVRHRCDNTGCQNFAHLLDGTQTDNVADMHERGRGWFPRGETHGQAKLSDSSVVEIRAAASAGESQRSLGQRFGVSATTIADCVSGRTWSHVPMPTTLLMKG